MPFRLNNVPDYEKTIARLEAWFNQEIIDRPPVTIGVPLKGQPKIAEKKHATLREEWFDFEYKLDCLEARLAVSEFVADTLPYYEPKMGPEIVSTLFGADLEFGETTSWSVPIVRDCREIIGMKPDFENVYWQGIRRATDLSLERSSGRWLTALPDLHTNGDLVASLRNPEDMCVDLVDDPEGVRKAVEYVTDLYPQIYEDTYARLDAAGQPSTTWAPFLHQGKAYVTNCDFICMISPKMFREAILPSIVREMRYLDCNYFHLDGPDALRHLDDLLALSELNGVQWVYGAGNGPAARWIDVYRRIQSAGKSIDLAAEGIEDARKVLEHLKPEGVWVRTWANSVDEAGAFVKWVARWSAGKE